MYHTEDMHVDGETNADIDVDIHVIKGEEADEDARSGGAPPGARAGAAAVSALPCDASRSPALSLAGGDALGPGAGAA